MTTGRATGAVAIDVDTLKMPAPLTHAFAVPPGTRLVFLSGLTAKDSDGRTVGEGDAEAQADHILTVIGEILGAAGGSIDDVIKLTVFLQDRKHAPDVGRARRRHFATEPLPASTMVVAQLMSDDQLVEIEAIAAISA
ncbi:RidA family protein [Naasia aerilata]|uniref:Enamine deaminase RidA n=1 Tax=Naasia aerilata TaxID=1162966 RepID=A0ABM8GA34_9MICO|nr:RidA family protein [Naasia aerilata]BDZ45056.1 enamine deaminase RidA [Naasia aerilata]